MKKCSDNKDVTDGFKVGDLIKHKNSNNKTIMNLIRQTLGIGTIIEMRKKSNIARVLFWQTSEKSANVDSAIWCELAYFEKV